MLERYRCTVPHSVRNLLMCGAADGIDETPKPGAAAFERGQVKLIATAKASLEAAAAVFRAAGVTPLILGDDVTGEAREVAKVHAALVREVLERQSDRLPLALISGGECTVTVRNPAGRGGRCAEYLLALALELEGCPGALALAADTDGIDGTETNAGAVLMPDMLEVTRRLGRQPEALLAANDTYGFFAAVGGLVETGPTRTNVNDYRVILVR